jgi:hypothetical protein
MSMHHSKEYRAASAQMKRVLRAKPSDVHGKSRPTFRPSPRKLKLKGAPRGKSFTKGNSFGVATRFKKGHRAVAPGFRHVSKEVSDALRRIAAMPAGTDFEAQSNAEWVAVKIYRMIQKGSLPAIRELINRCEGLPTQSIRVDGSTQDGLLLLIEGMDRVSSKLGAPEDNSPRFLEARNVEDDHTATGQK